MAPTKRYTKTVDTYLRKEWYRLRAPSLFKAPYLGRTLVSRSHGKVFASDSLVGRVVQARLSDLQGDIDLAATKIKLRVLSVRNRECLTNICGLEVTRQRIASLIRKRTSLVDLMTQGKTVDGYALRVFVTAVTQRSPGQVSKNAYCQQTHRLKLRERFGQIVTASIRRGTMHAFFQELMQGSMDKQLLEHGTHVFPLSAAFVRKVKVVSAPELTPAQLMQLHTQAPGEKGKGGPVQKTHNTLGDTEPAAAPDAAAVAAAAAAAPDGGAGEVDVGTAVGST